MHSDATSAIQALPTRDKPSHLQKRTGFGRLYHAILNSYRGLGFLLRHEAAFRQEVVLLGVAAALAFLLNLSLLHSVVLCGSVLMVMLVEIINTAIEVVVDRIGPEFHTLSGLAKDLGSSAVSVALVLMLMVWGVILLPLLVGG